MRQFFLHLVLAFTVVAGQAQELSQREIIEALDARLQNNPVFAAGHTGFALYDVEAARPVYGYQASRYFVPASNTKLLTFYVANRLLRDSVPALVYREYPDRTEVWGTGYPLLLHPAFVGFDTLQAWFSARSKPLVVNFPAEELPPRYGAGWSWDDFPYGYVYERSLLPVHGNRLYLDYRSEPAGSPPQLYGAPAAVVNDLVQDATQERTITRREGSNRFTVGTDFYAPWNFPLERALTVDSATTLRYLSDALPEIRFATAAHPRPSPGLQRSVMTQLPDTVYRKVLQDSDNFLAEQLILLAATVRYGSPDEEALFDWVTDTLFREMDLGEVSYRDGSGLSRYNLIQPGQLVRLVAALEREAGRDRLLNLLPAGGVNGTLENRFANRGETYVWAKTGSLSGVICISGLLRTRGGRWLAFSFLHNNVMGSSRDYYREMEEILGWVYDRI